jgi:hypothetical protein
MELLKSILFPDLHLGVADDALLKRPNTVDDATGSELPITLVLEDLFNFVTDKLVSLLEVGEGGIIFSMNTLLNILIDFDTLTTSRRLGIQFVSCTGLMSHDREAVGLLKYILH